MKNLLITLSIAAFASQAYALQIIDTNTVWGWPVYGMTDNVQVTSGATLNVCGNVNVSGYDLTIDVGSSLIFANFDSAEFKTVSSGLATPSTINIYGIVDRSGSAGVNFILSDQSSNNTIVNFYNGSQLNRTSGPINFEVRRGTGTINIFKGADVNTNDFNVGGRDDGTLDGTLNIDGGTATFGAWVRLGSTALKDTYSGKAALKVKNGGTLTTRDLVTNAGIGYSASIELKDIGSTITVTNAVVLGAATSPRSSSSFSVYTGANFKVQNANGLTSNAVSKVAFGLDSNIKEATATAMLSISKLTVNTSDSEKTFSIDLSRLGYVAGISEGDVVNVILIDSINTITFNGMDYLLADLDNAGLQDLFSKFMYFDFAGNEYWAAADISNITKEGNSIILSMTYIPEPSVCAAIFGALALAFAAYRRRK